MAKASSLLPSTIIGAGRRVLSPVELKTLERDEAAEVKSSP